MDFSFLGQSSDIKAVGNLILTLFSRTHEGSLMVNVFFVFKLSFWHRWPREAVTASSFSEEGFKARLEQSGGR